MKTTNTLITFFVVALFNSVLTPSAKANMGADLEPIYFYQNRYPLKNPYDKLVNNRGDGREDLYGTRNFRSVLNGVVYRGGANNAHNKYGKRSNQNPMPSVGLKNLCEEGFGTSVYLYTSNYDKAPKITSCRSLTDNNHRLNYLQASPHMSEKAVRSILTLVHNRLNSTTDTSPIYLHCWNGWHASGLISAILLRQFCGYSADQAVTYWNRNTDGNNVGKPYDRLRAKIRAFEPDPQMTINPVLKSKICPKI